MGEYADELIDRMIEGWSIRRRRQTQKARDVSCERCGKPKLRWGLAADGTHYLLEPGSAEPHRCQFKGPPRLIR